MPGIGVSAADLLGAYQVRRRLRNALDETVFGRCDVLITACGQATAARWTDFGTDWPPPRLANDMQTIPFSVTGHPAMSVPIGFAANGLPIGLQVAGRAFGEASVLRVAAAIEAELGQRDKRPPEAG
jgi:aspartyl-tRNA(Asn)/glutamyl-tRNA(Gln) amidotransferase subunit A